MSKTHEEMLVAITKLIRDRILSDGGFVCKNTEGNPVERMHYQIERTLRGFVAESEARVANARDAVLEEVALTFDAMAENSRKMLVHNRIGMKSHKIRDVENQRRHELNAALHVRSLKTTGGTGNGCVKQ